MMPPVMSWRVLYLAVTMMFLISACAGNKPHLATRPMEGYGTATVEEITVLADWTLRNMGYEVQQNNLNTGYIHATRRVPEDIYGRSTTLEVSVTQGAAARSLSVQAYSCPGCIHEGKFDPVRIADEFYQNFYQAARTRTWYAGQAAPSGKLKDNPRASDPAWKDLLDRLADKRQDVTTGQKAPVPAKPDKQPEQVKKTAPVKQAGPFLKINKVRTVPETVQPGGKFVVEINFTVGNGKDAKENLPVSFGYAIEKNGETLFEPDPEKVDAPNGQSWQIVKHLTATPDKGNYTIRVTLKSGSKSSEEKTNLTVK
jgi:hypothetical protein